MIRAALSILYPRIFSAGSKSSTNLNESFSFFSKPLIHQQNATFTSLTPAILTSAKSFSDCNTKNLTNKFLEPSPIFNDQRRTVIKFSYTKGKRKTVGPVVDRFFRLHWGIWIRTIAGRKKKLWKKRNSVKKFYENHVFCNNTQSKMLDKMVNKFWRKPKYYIDDPYAVYHKRENFYFTQTKPWRPDGVDYE